jgi:capsular polysaccharide transport system permease protein
MGETGSEAGTGLVAGPGATARAVVRRRPAKRKGPPPDPARVAAATRPLEELVARARLRHWAVLLSFLLLVAIPAIGANWYLQVRAADQYVSRAALAVESDEALASLGMFSDLVLPETAEASDTDTLYAYIYSQAMVERVDRRLDLRALWRKPGARDPWFGLGPDPSIEALLAYWERMVDVAYEARQGIVALRVHAFAPEDARAVAAAIVTESHLLVNALAEAARQDSVRFAQIDRDEARARLDRLRVEMRAFRDLYRIITPEAEVLGQAGLLSVLQGLLAEALVSRAQLVDTTRSNDPRLAQSDRRIAAITGQIADERRRLATEEAGAAEKTIAARLSRFEELRIEMDFAIQATLSAEAALESARVEARRISRYVKVHVEPTLAGTATYPRRATLGLLVALLLFTTWAVAVLVAYNLRDGR